MNFRQFKCHSNNGKSEAGVTAGETSVSTFYECGNTTKINCTIQGPMQKSQSADSTGESCQVKVNIEFIENSADPNNSILLSQFP